MTTEKPGTSGELFRERVIQESQDVAGLHVYKCRNTDDDGWIFVTARSPADAIKRYGKPVHNALYFPASREDLELIALRALNR